MKKQFRITLNGKTFDVVAEIVGEDDASQGGESGAGRRNARSAGAAAVAAPVAKSATAPAAGGGEVLSPLAGKVVSIDVAVGQAVTAGEKIATLEAMKMNTVVSAHAAGSVKVIHVAAGDSVEEGQPLLTIA